MFKRIKSVVLSQRLIGGMTFITICMLLLDLSAQRTLFFYEMSTFILTILVLVKTVDMFILNREMMYNRIRTLFVRNKWLIILFSIYFLWDFFGSFFVGEYEYFWQKYRVIFSTIVICGGIFYYCNSNDRIKCIKYTFVIMSVLISTFSLLNYVIFNTLSVDYVLKLSLRRDYNIFATVIYSGFVFGIFMVLEEKRDSIINMITAFMIAGITIPVMLLSGSRRIYLSIIPTVIIWIIYVVADVIRKKKDVIGKLSATVFMLLIVFSFVSFAGVSMESYMLYIYHNPESKYSVSIGNNNETMLKDRYDTAHTGNAMEKRKIIWNMAIEEYKSYPLKNKIFGKGTGYDILLYNNKYSSELDKAYNGREHYAGQLSAHNFILADLLNGGIIKAIICVMFMIVLGVGLIKLLLLEPIIALPYGIVQGILVISSLISGRFGILYDKILIILLAIYICQWGCRRKPFIYE